MTSTREIDALVEDPDVWQYIAAQTSRVKTTFAPGTRSRTILDELQRVAGLVADLLIEAGGPGLDADTVTAVEARARLADLDAEFVDEARTRKGRTTMRQIVRNRG